MSSYNRNVYMNTHMTFTLLTLYAYLLLLWDYSTEMGTVNVMAYKIDGIKYCTISSY